MSEPRKETKEAPLSDVERLGDRLNDFYQSVSALDQHDVARKLWDEFVKPLQEELERCESTVKNVEETAKRNGDWGCRMQAKRDAAEARVVAAEQEVAELEARLGAQRACADVLQGEVAELRANREKDILDFADLKARADRLQAMNDQLAGQVRKYSRELDEYVEKEERWEARWELLTSDPVVEAAVAALQDAAWTYREAKSAVDIAFAAAVKACETPDGINPDKTDKAVSLATRTGQGVPCPENRDGSQSNTDKAPKTRFIDVEGEAGQ